MNTNILLETLEKKKEKPTRNAHFNLKLQKSAMVLELLMPVIDCTTLSEYRQITLQA